MFATARTRLKPLASLCAAALLSACAGHVLVDGSWDKEAVSGPGYARILVVGLSPDYNTRCEFEWSMVSRLKSPATDAMPSCSRLKADAPLTREAIVEIVASTSADAVMTTELIDRSYQIKEGGGRDTRGTAGYKATDAGLAWVDSPGYGAYGVPVNVIYGEFVATPSLKTLSSKVSIRSTFYEAKQGSAVYTMTIRAGDLHARDSALATITPAIAERLRKDGVIR